MTKLTDERIDEIGAELFGRTRYCEENQYRRIFARAIEREAFSAGYRKGQEEMREAADARVMGLGSNLVTGLEASYFIHALPIKDWSE